MPGILIYGNQARLTLELASAARQIAAAEGGEICALTVNDDQQAVELSAMGLKVCSISSSGLSTADVACLADALQKVADQLGVSTVLLSSGRRGKELAGRLAEAWDAGCLTDVKGFSIEGGQVASVRNALGGATVATQVIKSPRRVIALSPKSFAPVEGAGGGSILPIEVSVSPPSVKLLETRSKAGGLVDIQEAERLVIVGQGVEKQEYLAVVEKIARSLGAVVACSKPVASDKKWLPEDRIVGLSGKICKPQLALVLGVSGQVQFTVGVREARVVASINIDENAYMNKISDYVLVADLRDVLPELVNALA